MKFSIEDFFSKCDQIRSKLRIWSHLLKKSLMEKFIFCAVVVIYNFSKMENNCYTLFQDNMTGSWWYGFCLLHVQSCSHFLFNASTSKIISRKFHGTCAKSFGNSAKDRNFLRFQKDSRNVFVNTSKGNFFLVITLLKQVHMRWKF